MNTICPTENSTAGARPTTRGSAHSDVLRFAALLVCLSICAGLTSCGFLKPAKPTARQYLLTPLPATGQNSAGANSLAVGVGQVKLPAYLFNTSLAIRKGTNEIEYLESAFWAERLDTAFQRVLAENLSVLLPTDHIRLSAWQKDDVAAEVYVAIEQFDADDSGRGVLLARWRILSPGGDKILKTGTGRFSRQGPALEAGASGVVATMSELVADLSQQLAQGLKEISPAR